ncbi:hypothetical protein D3C80_510080 [compost metagenome]
MAAVLGFQGQVQLRSASIPLQCFDRKAWQGQGAGLAHPILMVVHDLEQRVVAKATGDTQGLDQMLERQVLMGLGVLHLLTNALQQRRETFIAAQLRRQHLSVDEQPNQTLGLQAVAISHRHADTDISLTTVAVQQHLERGQQQHKQADPLLLRQLTQGANQCRRHSDAQTGTAVAHGRRAWVVARQLEHLLGCTQLALPVRQLTLAFPRRHPLTLPASKVGILNRQRRQLRCLALRVRRIASHQLFDHQAHRPAIGDNVMQHQHQ